VASTVRSCSAALTRSARLIDSPTGHRTPGFRSAWVRRHGSVWFPHVLARRCSPRPAAGAPQETRARRTSPTCTGPGTLRTIGPVRPG
jgi:hypothetical protein